MNLYRFCEAEGNSSLRSLNRHADALKGLADDFRVVGSSRTLPWLDPESAPIVEEWFLDSFIVPVLVGHIFHPNRNDPKARDVLAFTGPIEMLSVSLGRVRTVDRWYRLGEASRLAGRSLEAWSVTGAR
ncbi:hypothetical protein [Rhizobium anhuiense]